MHESEHPAQYNGPITRSRATRSRASIHTLPLEVLSTIFILVASDKQILAPIWKDPLPLCAVSSLWRSIALATPQLWQRISVRKSISRATVKSEAKELVLWIKRSELLPLTLVIWYRSFQYLRRSGRPHCKGSQPPCVPMGNTVLLPARWRYRTILGSHEIVRRG